MVLSKVSRTKESFKEKIESLNESTKEAIGHLIQNFESFSMEKYGKANLIPDLKQADEVELYDVLQNWLNWNDKLSPSTVRTYFSHLRKYLHYFGIRLNDQDIKNELTFKHKIEEERYGLKLGDIQSILKEMRYKNKVQYMCQLSSLMRIGEIIQLKKKHLILGQPNIIVKIPPTIAKFGKARTTFFSKESSKMLLPLLRDKKDEDIIFGCSNDPKKSAYHNKVNSQSSTKQVLRLAVKKVGLTDTYESTKRYKINTHSFRAWGITKISRHDPNLAKRLAGQKGYLLEYDRMTDQEKLEVYEKYESDLIIDNTEKQKAEIKKLEKEKSELQVSKKKVEDLERVQKMTLARIDEMGEKLRDKQVKQMEEDKQLTDEQQQELANLVHLKMDIDPKFKESFEKLLNEMEYIPPQLKKKHQ